MQLKKYCYICEFKLRDKVGFLGLIGLLGYLMFN